MLSICAGRILLHVRKVYIKLPTTNVTHNALAVCEEMDSDVYLDSVYEREDGVRASEGRLVDGSAAGRFD